MTRCTQILLPGVCAARAHARTHALVGVPRSQVHFGKFIGAYISGHYFFDIHPPFGKLVIALAAYSGGYRTTQPFEVIGEPFGPPACRLRRAAQSSPATSVFALVPESQNFSAALERK